MSKYQDLAQRFLYAQSVLTERSRVLLHAAGDVDGMRNLSYTKLGKPDHDILTARFHMNFNVAQSKLQEALAEFKAVEEELRLYFTKGEGAGPSI